MKSRAFVYSLGELIESYSRPDFSVRRLNLYRDGSIFTTLYCFCQLSALDFLFTQPMTNNTALKIANYRILSQLYESVNTIVYRGIQPEEHKPVILKLLKQDYPTPQELTRYRQEYEITHHLISMAWLRHIISNPIREP